MKIVEEITIYNSTFQFQLQIPIRSVVKVSKEKTAKIIPNAVGLATATEKHVSDQLNNYNTTGRFTVPLTFDARTTLKLDHDIFGRSSARCSRGIRRSSL